MIKIQGMQSLLFVLLIIMHFGISASFSVSEINKHDQDEVKQVCALFEDKTNGRETFTSSEDMLNMAENSDNRYKTFVCKTNTMPPVVVGALTCIYQRNGMKQFSSEVSWDNLKAGSRYKKTDMDAVNYCSFAVHPQYRRQGVATVLIKHADQFCREFGMKNIILSVYQNNQNAFNCYKKKGFQVLHDGRFTKTLHKIIE